METIEDAIVRIYDENQSISQKDLVSKLQEVKDPFRPGKQYWKNTTIRNRVNVFFKSKEKKIHFAPSDGKPSADIEGAEIKKHEDIFAPREEFIDTTKSKALESEISLKKPEIKERAIETSADQMLMRNIEQNIKVFKNDIIDLMRDITIDTKKQIDSIKTDMMTSLSDVKHDVSSLQGEIPKLKQAVAVAEPEIEYGFLELKLPIIEQIKKTCEEAKIEDESDYIDQLLLLEETYDSEMDSLRKERDETDKQEKEIIKTAKDSLHKAGKFDAFTKMITEAGGLATLRLDYNAETGQLGYKRGISTKMLIVGIAIAIGVGIGLGIGIESSLKLVHIIIPPFL